MDVPFWEGPSLASLSLAPIFLFLALLLSPLLGKRWDKKRETVVTVLTIQA